MKRRVRITSMLLAAGLSMSMMFGSTCWAAEEETAPLYSVNEEGNVSLKATGMVTYTFQEEQDEDWANGVTAVYIRETPSVPDGEMPEELTDAEKVDEDKYTISAPKVLFDSDLFSVPADSCVSYEVTVQSQDYEDYRLNLLVTNYRPTTFTIRTIDKDGNVSKVKSFTYDEMVEMSTSEGFYSSGCVMHGLISYKAQGVLLEDLLDAADMEFTSGMSLAIRTMDAPASVEMTEINNGKTTGEVVQNTQKYWMKPRFADRYRHSYDDLMGRERYFLTAQWEDQAVGDTLANDEGIFSFESREKLVENEEYMEEVKPMIALKYSSLQYASDPSDIRTYEDEYYDLTAEECAFRFLYGLALDNDPVVNVTAYDDEAQEYPIVETAEYEGKTAIEEGTDACGTNARQSMMVFGIDLFEDGSVFIEQ